MRVVAQEAPPRIELEHSTLVIYVRPGTTTDRGIGSCWIGFATAIGNSSEMKKELKVPDEYELVASIILGYPDVSSVKGSRKEINIIIWNK